MNRWRMGAVTMAAGACALGVTPCAAAGRATNEIPVSVSPTNNCTVSAQPLVFVIPVPVDGDVDANSLITIRCPPLTAFTVDIDRGLYPQGINRRVYNATANAYLSYDVFKDPPRSQVWGTGALRNVPGNSGLLGVALLPVYGRLASTRSVRAGGYNDTLTVTVTL